MIGMLQGRTLEKGPDYILFLVNGVGFEVYMTSGDLMKLPENSEATLYIHTHVREDALQLFGFLKRNSLNLFKKLINVSGLGPRGAVNILNASSPQKIISAIIKEDKDYLKTLPGIGPKSAAKMILDLKDKLSDEKVYNADDETHSTNQKIVADAVEALIVLGYSPREAQGWVNNALSRISPAGDTGTIVSYVLKNFAANR